MQGPNLPMVAKMLQQQIFTLGQFLDKDAIESWKNESKCYGDICF